MRHSSILLVCILLLGGCVTPKSDLESRVETTTVDPVIELGDNESEADTGHSRAGELDVIDVETHGANEIMRESFFRDDCGVDAALAGHKGEDGGDDLPWYGVWRISGTRDGERANYVLIADEVNDTLYEHDAASDITTLAKGRLVVAMEGEPLMWREDGISFAKRYFDWLEEPDPTAAHTDPFNIPTSWFEARCSTFAGREVALLEYAENGIVERWYFTRDGTLIRAEHANPQTRTQLTFTYDPVVNFPRFPNDVTRAAALLDFEMIYEKEDDDEYRVKYALGDQTTPVTYQEMEIVFYDENDVELGRLDTKAGSREHEFGEFRITDSNLEDIADEGDVWKITLPPRTWYWAVYDEWADEFIAIEDLRPDEAYTNDWDDGAPELPVEEQYAPVASSRNIARKYSWAYGGKDWTWDLTVPEDLYRWYVDQDIARANGRVLYDAYVSTPYDDDYIRGLSERIVDAGRGEGWSDDEILSFALAFVQEALPYALDEETSGFDEYPRYPIVTLVDGRGDCEDMAILYASLVRAMGYDAVMLLMEEPPHMAVGVASEPGGGKEGYFHQGVFYAYAEPTTDQYYPIGKIPPEFGRPKAQVLTLDAKPVLEATWRIGDEEAYGYQHAILEVANKGTAAMTDVTAWIGLHVGGDRYYDADSCDFNVIEPGAGWTCTVWLSLPPDSRAQVVFVAKGQPAIYERMETPWWTT